MKMFVANASPQKHLFFYRLPGSENNRQRQILIQPMSQERLPDDLDEVQIDNIVDQHSVYGFASLDDVRKGTVKKRHTRLVYSTGSPVPQNVIEALVHSNDNVLHEIGKRTRQEMAVAANSFVTNEIDKLKTQQEIPRETSVSDLDIQISEDENREAPKPSTHMINEGIRVANTDAARQEAPAPKRGRRR